MLLFVRQEDSCGVPVFYQQLPEIVKSSSILLSVFTGSADDTALGVPGVYHWFEHVPFRGTKKFPDGYGAVKGPISRVSGNVGASTNRLSTKYYATLPTRYLGLAVEVVTDLVAAPLLLEEGLLAEREIIKHEIRERTSSVDGYMAHVLPEMLWGNHSLAKSTLGTAETLDSVDAHFLRHARTLGYDKSRMAYFVSTSLSIQEVLKMLDGVTNTLPQSNISARDRAASYGPLAWREGSRLEFEIPFEPSVVRRLYKIPCIASLYDQAKYAFLWRLFCQGSSSSPLGSAVRDKVQLAYGASVQSFFSRDGGYWGFSAKTSAAKIEAVEDAFTVLMENPILSSRKWYDDVREALVCNGEMETIDSGKFVDYGAYNAALLGYPAQYHEVVGAALQFSYDEVVGFIEKLREEEPFIVIAKGK